MPAYAQVAQLDRADGRAYQAQHPGGRARRTCGARCGCGPRAARSRRRQDRPGAIPVVSTSSRTARRGSSTRPSRNGPGAEADRPLTGARSLGVCFRSDAGQGPTPLSCGTRSFGLVTRFLTAPQVPPADQAAGQPDERPVDVGAVLQRIASRLHACSQANCARLTTEIERVGDALDRVGKRIVGQHLQ